MTEPALRLTHPDWLFHHLVVAGPDDRLLGFRAAAAGTGVVPWQLDPDGIEEDWFHRLLGAGALSQHGAAVLSRQLRDAVVERHRFVASHAPAHGACPLDLHALVPVPDDVLALGPEHEMAVDWLWTHWGTAEPLRRVTLTEERDASGARLRFSFWAADWTPWRALVRLRDEWPDLAFSMHPQYRRDGRA